MMWKISLSLPKSFNHVFYQLLSAELTIFMKTQLNSRCSIIMSSPKIFYTVLRQIASKFKLSINPCCLFIKCKVYLFSVGSKFKILLPINN